VAQQAGNVERHGRMLPGWRNSGRYGYVGFLVATWSLALSAVVLTLTPLGCSPGSCPTTSRT
jgi:hypothetical protein